MDIFEQLRSGADVDMATPEYAKAIKHMTDCANICFKINTTAPPMPVAALTTASPRGAPCRAVSKASQPSASPPNSTHITVCPTASALVPAL